MFRYTYRKNKEYVVVILVSENGIFLTHSFSARNKNLRPLRNTNIPQISGKYGYGFLIYTLSCANKKKPP